MEDNRKDFALKHMARMLGVEVAAYLAWRRRGKSDRKTKDQRLKEEIQKIHQNSKNTYGAPRIKRELEKAGQRVSCQRITRLMKEGGLKTRCKRKFRVTTRSKAGDLVAENVLDRQFLASTKDQKWITDLTFLPTQEGWLYLSVILDVFSRKVVGWAFGNTLETKLALSALQMAQTTRRPAPGLLHHSDRGCQYTSQEYQQALRDMKATCSMSRKGNCCLGQNGTQNGACPLGRCSDGKLLRHPEAATGPGQSHWRSRRDVQDCFLLDDGLVQLASNTLSPGVSVPSRF
nr:IS3 family transposase [Deinococcus roseus]